MTGALREAEMRGGESIPSLVVVAAEAQLTFHLSFTAVG